MRELEKLRTAERFPFKTAGSATIQQLVRETNKNEVKLQLVDFKDGNLRDRLLKYDKDVIRMKYPNTKDKERLLRPAMFEALIEFTPTNKAEFLELVPSYLRAGTDGDEAEFLEQVFEIINASME